MIRLVGRVTGVAIVLAGVSCGPSGGQGRPASPSGLRRDKQGAEKPLAYWVGQAKRAEGPGDLEAAVRALADAVTDEAVENRVAASDALGALGPRAAAAAPALVGRLVDPSAWVRMSAMETLAAIGPEAVNPLLEAIETGKGPLRVRSVILLGSMGSDAKAAVGTLEKLLADEALPWRGYVLASLQSINPAKSPKPAAGTGAVTGVALPEAGRRVATQGDWPQFHGPNRDSICMETGLLTSWPAAGPKLLWKATGLGRGYSTVAIAGGMIFTMGDQGAADKGGRQCVIALDVADGTVKWVTPIGPAHDDGSYGTPTVDGDRLYAIGTDGDLVCLETAGGQLRWRKNFAKDFGGKMMSRWRFSESPLVDGRRLICTPGAKDAAIVALDKLTGRTIWTCALPDIGKKGKDGAGYASMIAAEIHGVRQVIQVLGRGAVGVEAETGRFLWGYNRIANTIANIPSALVRGNYVFVTTGYGTGAALLRIKREGDALAAEEVYFLGPRTFENHHGGVVLTGDHVYAGHGTSRGAPICIELATGKVAWKARAPQRGSASVLYAGGHILYRYDRGLVALVEATPEAYRLKAQFTPPVGKGPAWAHPVVHGRRLYLRHGDLLLCYDLGN